MIRGVKVVATIGGELEESRYMADEALRLGSDLVEFRLDLMWDSPPSVESVGDLVKGFESRSILTWRTKRHGGAGSDPPAKFLLSLAELSEIVDIEYEFAVRGIVAGNAIYSWHDPAGTPEYEELVKVAKVLLSMGMAKVVTLAGDELEAYRVLRLYRNLDHGGRLVAFSMGEKASFSRRLAAFLGSPLIYSYIGETAAPGQLTLREAILLKELLS